MLYLLASARFFTVLTCKLPLGGGESASKLVALHGREVRVHKRPKDEHIRRGFNLEHVPVAEERIRLKMLWPCAKTVAVKRITIEIALAASSLGMSTRCEESTMQQSGWCLERCPS